MPGSRLRHHLVGGRCYWCSMPPEKQSVLEGVMHRSDEMKLSISVVSFFFAFATFAPAHAQTPKQKHEGKIVCGSFSGDPKKYPAWNDSMEIVIERGKLIATPARQQGQVLSGTVAPSGA